MGTRSVPDNLDTHSPSLGARLHAVLHLHAPSDPWTKPVDLGMAAIVCLAALMTWLDMGDALGEAGARWTDRIGTLATVVLTVEYALRVAVAGYGARHMTRGAAGWRFVRSRWGLLDLVAILPGWISLLSPVDLGPFQLLRLLRLTTVFRLFAPHWTEFRDANRGNSLQRKIYNLLFASGGGGRLHLLVERVLIWAVAGSVAIVVLGTVASLRERFSLQFQSLDVAIGMIFLLEYVLRLYAAPCDPRYATPLRGRLRYALTPAAVIDLLALMPLLLILLEWELALLPVLRLFRMTKLVRHSAALAIIAEVVREERAILQVTVGILVVLTTLAGTGVYFVEHATQPDIFSSIPVSIYWAVVTMTSIGYGDIYPVTPVGRTLTMVIAIASLGMVALPAGIVATAFSERLRRSSLRGQARDAAPQVTPVERVAGILRDLTAEERILLKAALDAEASRIGPDGGRG